MGRVSNRVGASTVFGTEPASAVADQTKHAIPMMATSAPRTVVGRQETSVQCIPAGTRNMSHTAMAPIQTTVRSMKLVMIPEQSHGEPSQINPRRT